jgi:predicted dienelactone hydrolase
MTYQVGCRSIETRDAVQGASLKSWLLYPTHASASVVRFGPYSLPLAIDAEPARQGTRVVAFSHGGGGTPWSHRGLAQHLVREGFAVLMIEHPGNNRHDNSLGSPSGPARPELLRHRPRHVRLAFDASLVDPQVGATLRRDSFAMIGESMGGYTALAVAGGHAMTLPEGIDEARLSSPDAALGKLAFAVPTEPDPRIDAAVLLVPALGFFLADAALADVEIPLFVRTGERDPLCPASGVAQALRSLSARASVSSVDVPGAGHFSFQTPYPPELASIPPAQDPPGFDRGAYQPTLYADVARFLASRSPR